MPYGPKRGGRRGGAGGYIRVHISGPKWVVFGSWHYKDRERFWGALEVKWHIPSPCLPASKMLFSGIYSIARGSDWLWQETQETPQNGQDVHGFQVETPICHISEVSKRGWRTEGVGAKNPFKGQRFRPLFCTLLFYAPSEKGDKFLYGWGEAKFG